MGSCRRTALPSVDLIRDIAAGVPLLACDWWLSSAVSAGRAVAHVAGWTGKGCGKELLLGLGGLRNVV